MNLSLRTYRPAAALALASVAWVARAEPARPPNIVYILADDQGYGDTGVFYQNSRAALNRRDTPFFSTPNLDAIARDGVSLTDHYSGAPVCAPSRGSMLSGRTQGHANVRDNQFDKAIEDTFTLASVLKAAGYDTAAFGKWGLQGLGGDSPAAWPGYPTRRGFDYYFGYVRHKDGHFHYPKEDGREVWENDHLIAADLTLCYTTDLFTARAKKWIQAEHAAHANRPFFVYLAFDTPHAKLEYPPGPYPAGGGRDGGVQWLGHSGHMINSAEGHYDGWKFPAYAKATWDDDHNPATPEVPWPDVQVRYATSVRRIDSAVGDVRRLLADLGLDRNTLVVFTSDNGPSIESYLPGEPYAPTFFRGYGPFDGIKRDNWEGGVREPTLACWPARIPAGTVDSTPSGQWDWLDTFAAAAGLAAPAASDGVNLLPTLAGGRERRPSTIYSEYLAPKNTKTPNFADFAPVHRQRVRKQMQSIRIGDLQGVRYNIQGPDDDFEIYDVRKDPRELRNLALERGYESIQRTMKARVLQLRRPESDARRPYDQALVPAAVATVQPGSVRRDFYAGQWPWVPEFADLHPAKSDLVGKIGADDMAGAGGRQFTGYVFAPADGEYTFVSSAPGGSELFVHWARVIDADLHRDAQHRQGTIRLKAGWHPFRLCTAGGRTDSGTWLTYSGPGFEARPLSGDSVGLGPQPAASPSVSPP